MSRSSPPAPPSGARTRVFRVDGMDCAGCVRRVEDRLARLDGVEAAAGNPLSRSLRVAFDPERVSEERIVGELGRIGYVARRDGEEGGEVPKRAAAWTGPEAQRTFAAGTLLGLGLLLRFVAPDPPLALPLVGALPLSTVLFLIAAAVGGWNFFPAGARAARTLSLDMNFLMTVAIVGAVAIGEHPEAAAIAFLFSLAELLEESAVERARRSLRALLALAPEEATVLRDGEEVRVPADALAPGDVVVVRRGERVPADGTVAEGAAAVDEAPITGEAVPADRGPGDEVFAGTIAADGWLRVRVTKAADETVLAGIRRLIQAAEERKARSERFIERFARRYTPAVTAAAVLVAVGPPLLLGAPFETWFLRGLTLLVIACPCALVISTPVAIVSGITAAARNGVLIKGGVHLENTGRVRVVAFDKTGTLTYGHPEVAEARPLPGFAGGPDGLLALAAAVEGPSEHPVARAIVRAARERGLAGRLPGVTDFRALPGRGARARVAGHGDVLVGSPALFPRDAETAAALAAARAGGRTAVLVGTEAGALGVVALEDRVREGAAEAIAGLREAGVQRTVVLTGDAEETARAVADRLGADEVHAGLLPEEKVERVRALEARHGPVAMVGDGINDGPALAAATVGIAMGAAGSDIALETADVALMGDDLSRLPYLIRLSRTGKRVMAQNITLALVVKLGLAAAVPFGAVSLVVAVLVGDLGASLAVTLNALRLARVRPAGARPGRLPGGRPERLVPAPAG